MESGNERRQTARIGCDKPLWYSVLHVIPQGVESVVVTGESVDVSVDESGIGFRSPDPLYTGQLLHVVKDDGLSKAVVRWASSAATGYRAGAMVF